MRVDAGGSLPADQIVPHRRATLAVKVLHVYPKAPTDHRAKEMPQAAQRRRAEVGMLRSLPNKLNCNGMVNRYARPNPS
jgi:hypothetical protein